MATKIFEIKGEDWMKGFAYQNTLAYGGLFRQAANFDPFKRMGAMSPTAVPVQDTGVPVAKTVRYIASGQSGGTNYLYSYADDGSASYLYRTNATSGVTSDESSSITSTTNARGAMVYGGYLLYARTTTIRSCLINLSTNVEILTGLTDAEHPFTIGADLNIYFPNGNSIGKINYSTGLAATTGNSTAVFSLEASMTIRHLVNDGRYLVIMADNGGTSSSGKVNCVVAYWDMTSSTLTQRFDFLGNGLTGGVLMDSTVYVFGKDFLYVTNVGTSPKVIYNFLGSFTNISLYPTSPAQISQQGNSIFWGTSSGAIYAYGSYVSGTKKIFYHPYTLEAACSAFIQTGVIPYGATTGSKLYGIGFAPATNQSVTLSSSLALLPQPYRFEWAKITTRAALASGDTMTFSINPSVGYIVANDTFTFAADGAKRTKVFKATGGGVLNFDEFYFTLSSCNVVIEKLEIWGTPIDPQQQII